MSAVPPPNENWQRAQKDTASTLKYLFDSKDLSLSDVSFSFVRNNGTTEVIHAHKFVLAVRSSVFAAMFYGPMAETKTPIAVTDITASTFRTMLQYLYKDELNCVTHAYVLDLFYAAHKYDIESLRQLCSAIAARALTADMVFPSIRQADMYEAESLTAACYNFIDNNTVATLTHAQFIEQPRAVVETILKRSSLAKDGMPEKCIYKVAVRWAAAEAVRLKLKGEPAGVRIRQALGNILYSLRLPLLTPADIVAIKKDGVLSAEEYGDLLAFQHKVPDVVLKFPFESRVGQHKNPNPYDPHNSPQGQFMQRHQAYGYRQEDLFNNRCTIQAGSSRCVCGMCKVSS